MSFRNYLHHYQDVNLLLSVVVWVEPSALPANCFIGMSFKKESILNAKIEVEFRLLKTDRLKETFPDIKP